MELTRTQKRQRLLMMMSGAFAIFFTGYPHVWSIYQPYVMEQAGWSQGQASMCFYLALSAFVFGNIVGGRIQDQYNPRIVLPDPVWRKKEEDRLAAEQGSRTTLDKKQYTASEMMKTRSFYLLLSTMLFGLLAYFMLSPVSQTYQIEAGIPVSVAVSAVMFGSAMNAGTRLLLPTLSDKVGRSVCIKGVLAVSVAAMLVLSTAHSYAVTASIIVMYGCYGGIMGSFPSFTSSVFGLKHAGENYGFVMFGIVIATFGAPAVTGFVTGKGYGMQAVFAVGVVSALIALVCMMLLGRELKKMNGSQSMDAGVSKKVSRA